MIQQTQNHNDQIKTDFKKLQQPAGNSCSNKTSIGDKNSIHKETMDPSKTSQTQINYAE